MSWLLHLIPITNFKIQRYYQNEPKFNGVYSRDNLSNKIKDGTHVINFDEYVDIGDHWIALFALNNDVTYFNNFAVENIPKEVKKFINNKNIIANIFRIKAYDPVMCEYFGFGIVGFLFKGKNLTDFTNIFQH